MGVAGSEMVVCNRALTPRAGANTSIMAQNNTEFGFSVPTKETARLRTHKVKTNMKNHKGQEIFLHGQP